MSSEDPSHKYFWKVETLPALSPEGKICCWCIISVWSSGNLEENTGCSKCLFSLSNCHGASIFCTLSALESSVYLAHIYMMRACFRILNPLKNMAIKNDLFLSVGFVGRLPSCLLNRWESLADIGIESSGWEAGLPSLRRDPDGASSQSLFQNWCWLQRAMVVFCGVGQVSLRNGGHSGHGIVWLLMALLLLHLLHS